MSEERKLTDAEKRRLELFEEKKEQLIENGYSARDMTISVVKANFLGTLYGVLLALPFFFVYITTVEKPRITASSRDLVLYIPILLALTVIHELIHGITWSFFAGGFRDNIEFGVVWKMLTPYCTCKKPLNKWQYLIGGLMPCLILGIIPSAIACVNHNGYLIFYGLLMIACAGGDLCVSTLLLKSKTKETTLFYDHPTKCGFTVFEK